jgi:hypothetical protein
MARPRTPAKVLELRGSFRAHPERKREDAPGAGPWSAEPPEHLTGSEIAAWREVVESLPKVALTATERLGVAQMARLWAALKTTHPASPDFKKLDDSFRQWAVQMGMTLQARTKLGTSGESKGGNPFDQFGERGGTHA